MCRAPDRLRCRCSGMPRPDAEDAGERVVRGDAGAVVGPVPDPRRPAEARQRHQDRHRPHQVRGDPAGEQPALGQRLVHQMQLELLQIAQAAVDQLAGPAGRAGGQVTGLDQGHAQAAGGGVQGRAGAGHPAADDEHVELLVTQPPQVGDATDRGQPAGRIPGDGGITHPSHVSPRVCHPGGGIRRRAGDKCAFGRFGGCGQRVLDLRTDRRRRTGRGGPVPRARWICPRTPPRRRRSCCGCASRPRLRPIASWPDSSRWSRPAARQRPARRSPACRCR